MRGLAVWQPLCIAGLSIMFILTLALLLTAACGDQGSAKDENGGVTKTLRTPWSTPYMAIGAGSLWLANDGVPYGITRVDLAKSEVVAQIEASGDPRSCDYCAPHAVDASGDQVWFTDRATKSVSRIDPETDRIVESIPVGFRAYDIAIDGDTLWLTDTERGFVARVDTKENRVVERFDVGGAAGIIVGSESVWVAEMGPMVDGPSQLARIDPQTNEIVEEIPLESSHPQSMAYGAGSVWIANGEGSCTVSRVDPQTNEEIARINTGLSMFDVAVGGGSVWATGFPGDCGKKGVLLRIDPKTNKIVGKTNIPCAFGVAATDDAVWVQGVVKEEGKWTDHLMRVKPTVQ